MSALIRKEIRSIFPALTVAMALAVLPVWILWPAQHGTIPDALGVVVFAPFAFGVLLLSLTPFGQELNWGTLSVLLAQPVARQKLWAAKTLVLAVALGAVFLALFVSNYLRVDTVLTGMKHTVWRNAFDQAGRSSAFFAGVITGARHDVFRDTVMVGGVAVLVGFAGGLWTTLLLRQVAAAFWVTLLVPAGLGMLAAKALGNLPDPLPQGGVLLVLGTYSAAGFFWAKRLFFQAQDTHWTGGFVSFAVRPVKAYGYAQSGARKKKVARALLAREFETQFINLVLAGVILVLHVLVVVFRKLNADYLATHRSVEMTLEAFPVLWLAIPLLIGSAAFAEERKNGTLTASLCLPASPRIQFFMRLGMAIVLGIVCGGVLPLGVEILASLLGVGQNRAGLDFLGENRSALAFQLFAAAGITGLSLYASSLARSTLHAIGLGLLSCLAGCVLIVGAQRAGDISGVVLWGGKLIGWIGWPTMVLTWLFLTYRNCRQVQMDSRAFRRNILTWLVVIPAVACITTTLYHRVWEAWMPEEPGHSAFPALFAGNNGRVNVGIPNNWASNAKIRASDSCAAVLLPDGRLWLKQTAAQIRYVPRAGMTVAPWRITGRAYTGFVEGSNWKDVAASWSETFAIKKDGTLWSLSPTSGSELQIKQIGQSKDWESVCAGADHFCALKLDGTLWQWGHRTRWAARFLPAEDISVPVQVGADSDWSAVSCSWDATAAFKTDGTIWKWNWALAKESSPRPWFTVPCTQPASIAMNEHTLACVCPDGTLWLGCDSEHAEYYRLVDPQSADPMKRELVRWGKDADWREIHWVGWGKALGIKRDGSMWEWNTQIAFGPLTSWTISPTMPSRYMDWVCAEADAGAFFALARDGSLCLWGDPRGNEYSDWNGPDPRRWLMPSRIKARRVADFSHQR